MVIAVQWNPPKTPPQIQGLQTVPVWTRIGGRSAHQPDELGNFSGTGDVDEATARALFLLRMELAAKRPFSQLPGTIAWRTQDGANEHAPRSQDLSALTGKKPVRE